MKVDPGLTLGPPFILLDRRMCMDQIIGHVPLRRRVVAFAALFAALSRARTPAATSAGAEESSPAAQAADWIAREYRAPDSEIKLFGTGILIDALVSLAATGTQSATAVEMLSDLRAQASAYVGSGDAFNVGGAGKLIHVLEVYGEDVVAFTGRDLEAEVRALQQTTGVDAGRFAEASVWDQSLVVLGLAMTDEGVPQAAVDWLADAQCPSGEFTYDGSCPGPTDADTTGLAALALIAAGESTTAALSVDWLIGLQLTDGSVPGYGTPNSNSTASSALAFVAAGEIEAANSAASYLATMQFPQSAGEADAGGLKWIESDTAANTFATVQGVWGMGVPALHLIQAPQFTFNDSVASVFSMEIEWLAAVGITSGCNPPLYDGFCPDDPVTRGQMAALLNRALELPPANGSGFVDAVDSVFADDIAAIAAAGITVGCNPPDNDRYCVDDPVTRGQMAAFMVRAFDLESGGPSGFNDIAGSVFKADIDAIAAAGITVGCNPPDNDRYCVDDPVTRGQMAAFIYRAMHG